MINHRSLWHSFAFLLFLLTCTAAGFCIGQTRYVTETCSPGCFVVMDGQTASPILVDGTDWPGVIRAARDLQTDVERVTGKTPKMVEKPAEAGGKAIIVGTIGKSALVNRLVANKKIDISAIKDKWEAFSLEVVSKPLPGISQALVIVGSDKRGTIYGIYDLSEQIGVSPWVWWADVPVQHRDRVFVKAGKFTQGPPAVKYRGIFLNDEAPALTGWAKEKFGGLNSKFYTRVFELLLRMKGNYLWPAMWDNAFNEDDPDKLSGW